MCRLNSIVEDLLQHPAVHILWGVGIDRSGRVHGGAQGRREAVFSHMSGGLRGQRSGCLHRQHGRGSTYRLGVPRLRLDDHPFQLVAAPSHRSIDEKRGKTGLLQLKGIGKKMSDEIIITLEELE